MKCSTCLADGAVTTYTGESGFSAYFRAGLHQKGLRAENPRSTLWQHVTDQHNAKPGEGKLYEKRFLMDVTGSHRNSARRLIAEGILIEREFNLRDGACREREGEERPDMILNGKAQWYQPALPRMKAKPYFE